MDSPCNLLQAEFDSLVETSHISKRASAKTDEKLKYLLSDEEFVKHILNAIKQLCIFRKYESKNLGRDLIMWVVAESARGLGMQNLGLRDMNGIINNQVRSICDEFQLSEEWQDLVLYAIATYGKKPGRLNAKSDMHSHVVFVNSNDSDVTLRISKGVTQKEFLLIWAVLSKYFNTPIGSDILPLIIEDRRRGLSWNELSKKYKLSKENIRSRIRYNNKK